MVKENSEKLKQKAARLNEELKTQRLKNQMLKADVVGHWAESSVKIIGAVGLAVTTLSQIVITIVRFTGEGTHRIMKSTMHASGGGGSVTNPQDIIVTLVNKTPDLFNLPQYGLFGLMAIFAVMIFMRKKKKGDNNASTGSSDIKD